MNVQPTEPLSRHKPAVRRQQPVWDIFVRLFHWGLVVAVAIAGITGFLAGATWIDIHVLAGSMMAGLVLARILWGVLGGTHARFSRFVASPAKTVAHLKSILQGAEDRHAGHNPLGAWMILALLATGLGLAATGFIVFGGEQKAGPLGFATSYETGHSAKEIHELLAWALLALVGLHIAGALFESRRTGENLPRSMVTGTKEVREGDHLPEPAKPYPGTAVALGIALGGLLLAGGWNLSARPDFHAPLAPLDEAYMRECSACHIAYHPSLLPRPAWTALMASLDDHFGEDASLDAKTTAELTAYLTAHSAEAFDTKVANRLTATDPAHPFTITRSPFWTRKHADIPDAVFASNPVKAKGNCAACHGDAASGRFYPGTISIPKETKP